MSLINQVPSADLFAANANASTGSSSSTSNSNSSQNTPSNTLGPDAFITLLTAQLQAQDPLNPLDPNQMVNELTSMNTLQQIIQIRQDLDSLVSSAKATGSGNGSSNALQAASVQPIASTTNNSTSAQAIAAMMNSAEIRSAMNLSPNGSMQPPKF